MTSSLLVHHLNVDGEALMMFYWIRKASIAYYEINFIWTLQIEMIPNLKTGPPCVNFPYFKNQAIVQAI